ncbi:branched-chain amino acid ABC transporter permease [Chelatococcus asaccharovorans]|uniref:branched-chain amino acid ABC transporter permease n=1 Tax=Chelatococcus asaccharovorans TaxID=28210 RepID=UPI00224C78B1|nr:branched-chain amino acid ABC transporter permease [Chelatococcus asaccharovorans]CAH1663336.1 Amino acid/amide ABC transporter membrane protein 2 (HAAT family) [Chelatococcus asaccharovorans]CAH1682873.1 Amino acid/amide ABC transporter membrane protein 2 (HAAT family) [Chelatococcus asaccharovorans]
MTDAARPVEQSVPAAAPASLRQILVPIVVFAGLAIAPWIAQFGTESFILSLLTRVMVLGLAALSLDLLIGYAGLVSFGQAAFIGIGAYAVGILASHGINGIALQTAAALAASAIFAAITGAISLRTRGVYFIMITLAFGQMLFFLATSLAAYGGDDGMTLPSRSLFLGYDLLDSDRALYYVAFVTLGLVYLACRMLVASRFGRVLRGAKQNPVRMQAIGFSPYRYQLVLYIIAGMIAALAGVLLANTSEFVSPATMSWQRSGDLIFMVVLGGMGSLHGAILGAIVFLLAEEVLAGFTEHWHIIFGPLLILCVLYIRGGITPLIERTRP